MDVVSSPRSSFIVILNTEEVPSQANWGIAAKNLIEKWDRPVLDMLGVNLSTAIDTVFLTLRNVEEGITDYIRWGFYENKPLDWFPVDITLDGYTRSYRIIGDFFLGLKNIKSKGIVKYWIKL